MKIRIYVEGGGEQKIGKEKVRQGFGQFFQKALGESSTSIRVIACGGRSATFRDFKNGVDAHPDEFVILLVDSEARVVDGDTVWTHLKKRDPSWEKPLSTTEDQFHLMVQTMEAWLIADLQALQNFYKQHFNENPIPKNSNVEDIEKARLEPALQNASKNTTKGIYHKINHGPQLLGMIDPQRVQKASRHCKRLLDKLIEILQ